MVFDKLKQNTKSYQSECQRQYLVLWKGNHESYSEYMHPDQRASSRVRQDVSISNVKVLPLNELPVGISDWGD